jgi:3'-phosphoadenosine 5'-phosphosulfate sulfotransferase (PAPS reductase)/FAD synthetase
LGLNPYKIEGPALISFSGGRTSGFMLKKILDAYEGKLPSDVHVVFANTGKEMPQTLDFINDCANNWQLNIVWLELEICDERPIYRTKEVTYDTASREGEPFSALIQRKKMLPNPYLRICTQELKMNVMKRYMVNLGYKEWNNVVGLRYDEQSRVAKIKGQNESNKNKWYSLTPLYEDRITLSEINNFWKESSFDLSLPSFDGKTLAGNCDLCFLKGTKTLTKLVKEKPELADWWINEENKIGASFKKSMKYLDVIELSQNDEKQIDMFDDDSRSCFCHD